MIRWYRAALAPILLWCSTSAYAADVRTIDCVGKLINQTTINSVSDDFRASIERAQSGLPELPAQRGSASDPAVRAEVDKAAERCGAIHGWTPAAKIAASDYAFEKLALPIFEASVRDDGIDPGRVARLSKGLNSSSGWEEERLPEAEKSRRVVAAIILRLLREGVSLQTPQQTRDVSALAMWRVHLDRTQTAFIAA